MRDCNKKSILTAPDECFPQMKKFSTKTVPNITAGYSVAVYKEK